MSQASRLRSDGIGEASGTAYLKTAKRLGKFEGEHDSYPGQFRTVVRNVQEARRKNANRGRERVLSSPCCVANELALMFGAIAVVVVVGTRGVIGLEAQERSRRILALDAPRPFLSRFFSLLLFAFSFRE